VRLHELAGAPFGVEALIGHMRQDKKAQAGGLTFVLARDIGEAFTARDVDAAALRAFLISEGAV
jgi:3-dehydroquinate synthase